MDWLSVLFLVCVGVFGGAWNAVAGGATLFTFPALMAVGLPPVVANATNYLALIPSNAAALPAYRAELVSVRHRLWPLIVVSMLGAAVGSTLLLRVDPALVMELVPVLIFMATMLFAFGDRVRAWTVRVAGEHRNTAFAYTVLFFSSVYGGFFGAGLGIILLAIAQIMGFSAYHVANAVKNLLGTCFTLLSIAVFGVGGLIAWPEACVMMVGSTLGGYAGGRYARKVNEKLLRSGVIAFGLLLSVVYAYRQLVA